MTKDEALKLALEALGRGMFKGEPMQFREQAITAIKEALKHPSWIGLTNDELTDLFYNQNLGQQSAVGQAIALLRERNER
jgi:hypothetical protein